MFCSRIIGLISIFKKYDLTNQWIWIYEQKRDLSPIRGQEKTRKITSNAHCGWLNHPIIGQIHLMLLLIYRIIYIHTYNIYVYIYNIHNTYTYTYIIIHVHNYIINTYHYMDIFHGGHVWKKKSSAGRLLCLGAAKSGLRRQGVETRSGKGEFF